MKLSMKVCTALPSKALLTAYQLTRPPQTITAPERMAVKRTPILSRMMPAKIRKKTKTLRNVSEPA